MLTLFSRYTSEELFEAVLNNDVTLVDTITASYRSPNSVDFAHYLALREFNFTRFNKPIAPEIIFTLIKTQYYTAERALLHFIKNNQTNALERLLHEYKISFHSIGSVLPLAITGSSLKTVEILLKIVKQNLTGAQQALALRAAAKKGLLQLTIDLLFQFPNVLRIPAWEVACENQDVVLVEALINAPDFLSECFKNLGKTPLAYALSLFPSSTPPEKNEKLEVVIRFLLDRTLNAERFGLRMEATGEVFFEKTNTATDYLWTEDTLKHLFSVTLTCPRQINTLLKDFPDAFKPIAKIIFLEEANAPLLTSTCGNLQYRTSLGEVAEKYKLLAPLPNINQYRNNIEPRYTQYALKNVFQSSLNETKENEGKDKKMVTTHP